jgi:hypothetical protein
VASHGVCQIFVEGFQFVASTRVEIFGRDRFRNFRVTVRATNWAKLMCKTLGFGEFASYAAPI